MEAKYTPGTFAATDQRTYWDSWSPAEKLNKSTIVRINVRRMNCFKNTLLLVKHLALLSFPRVSNSTPPAQAPHCRSPETPAVSLSCQILYPACNSKSVCASHMDAKSPLPQTEHFPLPTTFVSEKNGREFVQGEAPSSNKIPLELQMLTPEQVQMLGVHGL